MKYSIDIRKKAGKSLSKIPTKIRNKIIAQIKELSEDPYPPACKKLTGREAWRIRIADYRVIYEVEDGKLIILVLHIAHRKDVYRKN